jgi:hypothetical protein
MDSLSYCVSSLDINIAFRGKHDVLSYSKLRDYDNIDDLFRYSDCIFLLYEISRNYGHWVLIINHGDFIEHFDSYGIAPDHEFDFISDYVVGKTPLLSRLYLKSNKPIHYNSQPLQSMDSGVSTCGKWCIIRVFYKTIPIDAFCVIIGLICKNINETTDSFVNYLFLKKLKKHII